LSSMQEQNRRLVEEGHQRIAEEERSRAVEIALREQREVEARVLPPLRDIEARPPSADDLENDQSRPPEVGGHPPLIDAASLDGKARVGDGGPLDLRKLDVPLILVFYPTLDQPPKMRGKDLVQGVREGYLAVYSMATRRRLCHIAVAADS